MDRDTFERHFRTAAEQSLAFARRYVVQTLPNQMVFRVYPNQSYDGNPRVADEEVFPEETLGTGCFHGPWTEDEVVGFLWRNGNVPEWVDIAVESEDTVRTIIALRCCGRFTSQEELLYHRPSGCPPFLIKSPNFPPGLWEVEGHGKFDLHWKNCIAGKPRIVEQLIDLEKSWEAIYSTKEEYFKDREKLLNRLVVPCRVPWWLNGIALIACVICVLLAFQFGTWIPSIFLLAILGIMFSIHSYCLEQRNWTRLARIQELQKLVGEKLVTVDEAAILRERIERQYPEKTAV